MVTLAFEAIGTQWSIEYEPGQSDETIVAAAIAARIEAFDQAYSRFRADSLVTQMSQRAGIYRLPDDAAPMFDLYRQVYGLTGGEATPLIGQTLADAGYDATYSFEDKSPVTPPAWDEVLNYHFPELELKQPALLDVGAAGKGYLVDLVAELLVAQGVRSYSIDAGGDIAHRSLCREPIIVGLEHPDDSTQAIGTVELLNQSLCGSAGNRRTWGDYHHILSPSSLRSPRQLKAVWVVASSTLLADMLTTCLWFVSPEHLATVYDFEYVLVRDDYTYNVSPRLMKGIFT